MKDRVALVTGASRGIGRAVALELAEAGAHVVVNYAGSEGAALEVAERIRAKGREALLVRANVASADDVEAMVKQVLDHFGRVDILVNNAGITRDNLVMRMKDEEWDEVLAVNLKGAFLCAKAVARPMMKQRYGRIVNISSVVALRGNAGQANYVAAKAGLIGLTKTLARELASRGITVNAVAPGFIVTDMTAKLGDDVREALLAQIPLGAFGRPEDVAKAVRFLASDDAAYITGQVLCVDGGMAM